MPSQVCTRCNLAHHSTSFPNIGPPQRLSMCVTCRRTDRKSIERKRRRDVHRSRVDAYKAASGCLRCDIKDPIILQFHHPKPNKGSVSALVQSGAKWDRIEAEIAECEVLCFNCHCLEHQKCKITGDRIPTWSPNDS